MLTFISGTDAAVAPPSPTRVAVETARKWVHWFHEQTGLHCACFHAATAERLAVSHPDHLPYCPLEFQLSLDEIEGPRFVEPEDGLLCMAVPVTATTDARLVLTTYVATRKDRRARELLHAAQALGWNGAQQEQFWCSLPVSDRRIVESLVRSVVARMQESQRVEALQHELSSLAPKIDYASSESGLLHLLTERLQGSRNLEEIAAICLDRLQALIDSAGFAILIEDHQLNAYFLVKGQLPFDEVGLGRLLARFENHDWTRPLVQNRVEQTSLAGDFPGLKSFLAAPIGSPRQRLGWLLACNRHGSGEFGPAAATLFHTVTCILATHLCNTVLAHQHDELLIGFIRSLVSTLDAKDAYTRGHSERVALIARRLGRQLGLADEALDDVYLAALLHDFGKIGIDDRVLRKADRLTPDELRHIQHHPLIGYQALRPLKSLCHILPGVRNHHEAYNGLGYPDGLKGEAIPLIARIITVADAYDAMGSNRPYREGLPLDRLEDMFRDGAGQQWDPRVIDAYFEARDDILRLSENYSLTDGNLFGASPPFFLTSMSQRTHPQG